MTSSTIATWAEPVRWTADDLPRQVWGGRSVSVSE